LGLSAESVSRKLYSFYVLGLIVGGKAGGGLSLDELVGATLLKSLQPVEPPRQVTDDPENLALANEIGPTTCASCHQLFELLGVPESAGAVEIRDHSSIFRALRTFSFSSAFVGGIPRSCGRNFSSRRQGVSTPLGLRHEDEIPR